MIDGIVSGKLLLKPKLMRTRRGSAYLIAKMTVYSYQVGNTPASHVHGDLIVFDRTAMREMAALDAGAVVSVCGIITPTREAEYGIEETVLRIVVKCLVTDYLKQQRRNQGELFGLIAKATGRA